MPQFDLSMLLSGQYHQWLVSGFFLSIKLSLLAFVLALPLAIVVALLRLAPAAPLRAIGQTYVEAIRNVPLLAHMLFWYFGAPQILPQFIKDWLYSLNYEAASAVIALVLYTAAYMAEDIRSGIRSIPKEQLEASRALGLSYMQAMQRVILPQALRNMLPSLVNQLVSTIKETSLGYIISLPEVSFVAGQISTAVMVKSAEVYGLLAISYFVMCFSLTRVAFFLERRLAAHAPSKP